ncbi:UNVERIFIED_CONTAM: hypothetical protein FKN15_076589 [Acipenser sinensis]
MKPNEMLHSIYVTLRHLDGHFQTLRRQQLDLVSPPSDPLHKKLTDTHNRIQDLAGNIKCLLEEVPPEISITSSSSGRGVFKQKMVGCTVLRKYSEFLKQVQDGLPSTGLQNAMNGIFLSVVVNRFLRRVLGMLLVVCMMASTAYTKPVAPESCSYNNTDILCHKSLQNSRSAVTLLRGLMKNLLASYGKFYLVIEELSQLFRALVPIQLWYKYIVGEDPSNSYLLGGVLLILYSLSKSFDVCGRVGALRKAMKMLCISQSCGVRASSQQSSGGRGVCAICQAEFRDPVILMCQHVFCDECVCLWFDCERTCPLCRSAVIETLRYWKDGTTSAHFQVY